MAINVPPSSTQVSTASISPSVGKRGSSIKRINVFSGGANSADTCSFTSYFNSCTHSFKARAPFGAGERVERAGYSCSACFWVAAKAVMTTSSNTSPMPSLESRESLLIPFSLAAHPHVSNRIGTFAHPPIQSHTIRGRTHQSHLATVLLLAAWKKHSSGIRGWCANGHSAATRAHRAPTRRKDRDNESLCGNHPGLKESVP